MRIIMMLIMKEENNSNNKKWYSQLVMLVQLSSSMRLSCELKISIREDQKCQHQGVTIPVIILIKIMRIVTV